MIKVMEEKSTIGWYQRPLHHPTLSLISCPIKALPLIPLLHLNLFSSPNQSVLLPPSVSIEDVECVRSGRHTEGLRKHTEEAMESRAFSILFKGHRKNLDLIANSKEEAKHWVSGLEKIISNMSNLSQQQRTEQYP